MNEWTPENCAWAFAGAVFAFYLIRSWFVSKADEEEEEMANPEFECSEDSLLEAKRECLSLSHSMQGAQRSADDIVKDAQKFWDFIRKEDVSEED